MELPNIHFQDFPIEFKEINSLDFKLKSLFPIASDGFTIENNEKIIIEGDKKGYINEALQSLIKLEQKNTVVINASVGCGKSYAIIQTIKRYYESRDNYLIIVATPFVSLVEQYVNDIHKDAKIPQEQIYNYADLGRKNSVNYLDKKVQVITVNSLLGNPGEDGFKNSDIKRQYLNSLIKNCKENNIKVVFVYDEIHDAIQNFKEEFIFNLWKWKDVIVKNFIISATFNEASKVVIEYLAELTDKKIQIIESDRIRKPKKQSDLHLHYSSEYNFTNTTYEVVKVINDLMARDKNIDVLCYSKSLAKSIMSDSDIGQKLKDKFGGINNCTSELISNQRAENEAPKNRYDNSKCNIGTNFKTGVSIKKKNHAFVIIMPPRATRLWFRNKSGIFSDGINSIIQALARQRNKGEIHIILPRPDRFDFASLDIAGLSKEQIEVFSKAYKLIQYYGEDEYVKYFPLKIQEMLMRGFYLDVLKENVLKEIEHISELERKDFTRLEFPPYNVFKLNRGEEYLANTFKFFGDDISAYVTYCAFTNQFINCNLVKVNYKTTLFFEESKIQKRFNYYFNQYFTESYYSSRMEWANFNMAYSNFRNDLYQNFDLRFKKADNKKWVKINPYNNKAFEVQLLRFVAQKFYGNNYYNKTSLSQKLEDLEYTRSNYVLDSISLAKDIKVDEVDYSDNYKKKIRLYQILNQFRDKLIANVKEYNSSTLSYKYFKNKPSSELFDNEDKALFQEFLDLIQYDEILNNEVFEFKRTPNINSFYTRLIEDNFEYESSRLSTGKRDKIKKIINVKPLPTSKYVINLIMPSKIDHILLDDGWILKNYGSIEEYEKRKNKIDSILKEYYKL